MHGKQTGNALDHHLAHVGERLADQCDAPCRRAEFGKPERDAPHPFGAGARLARAAAAEDEPGFPVSRRRKLILARPQGPVVL